MTPKGDKQERTVELIATVAHEIRSPLTTIKGFTKTLLDRWDKLDEQLKLEMLQAINEDADRVTRILTELLDVSRLEAGTLSLKRQLVDLREVAADLVDKLGLRSDKHTVTLAAGDPCEVRADPDKVRQVLTNFIENAQKYTDAGSIIVSCAIVDELARVAVADEGSGIEEVAIPALFEKFSRRELPGSPTGTGLGLYICKGLVEAHGGDIGVTSVLGTGSTFWFTLPASAE